MLLKHESTKPDKYVVDKKKPILRYNCNIVEKNWNVDILWQCVLFRPHASSGAAVAIIA